MYIKRHAAQTLLELKKHFGAVLVTGPRQAGKTTLIEETIIKPGKGKINQVTLDDPIQLEAARLEKRPSLSFRNKNDNESCKKSYKSIFCVGYASCSI